MFPFDIANISITFKTQSETLMFNTYLTQKGDIYIYVYSPCRIMDNMPPVQSYHIQNVGTHKDRRRIDCRSYLY